MLGKINNVVRIPTTKEKFFKYWFEFLKPFHNLTNREIEVISSFVKHRYKLSLNITSEELLNKIIKEELLEIKEEFSKLTTSFNIPSLGKLACPYDKYKRIKAYVDSKKN